SGNGRPGGRPVRGEVIGRSLLLGLLLGGAGFTGIATAAEPCAGCVTAGASTAILRLPPGTPLAGYGGMKRRLLFPDLFGREALVAGGVSAVQRADRARVPALAATTSVTAPAVTASRLGKPLDQEIVVLKLTTLAGAPLALVWNFAIHGTMLSASDLRLSGDV